MFTGWLGEGTEEFSHLVPGDSVDIMGPLGNGFSLQEKSQALLIGGGIGIPPMLELAKQWPGEKAVVAGYRDRDIPAGRFCPVCKGIYGNRGWQQRREGNVSWMRSGPTSLQADVICACGPTPMLRALKAYAQENGIECWISHGRADGLRYRRLSGLCLSVYRSGRTLPMCTTSASARTARYFRAAEVEL